MIRQGEVYYVPLPSPTGSEPGFRRPGVVVQSDSFNASAIATTVVALITSQERRAADVGNVVLDPRNVGLDRVSIVNVSQLYTVGKAELEEPLGELDRQKMNEVLRGVLLVLGLGSP